MRRDTMLNYMFTIKMFYINKIKSSLHYFLLFSLHFHVDVLLHYPTAFIFSLTGPVHYRGHRGKEQPRTALPPLSCVYSSCYCYCCLTAPTPSPQAHKHTQTNTHTPLPPPQRWNDTVSWARATIDLLASGG